MEARSRGLVEAARLGAELEGLSNQIIGAAIEVHRELGPGFLESAYEEALSIELALREIRFERQAPVTAVYKGHEVGRGRIDLLVEEQVVVEIKAVESITPGFVATTISYLRAKRLRLDLIINFNVPLVKDGIKRVVI